MSVEVERQIFARITGPELTRRTVHQQSNFLICLFIKKINYFKKYSDHGIDFCFFIRPFYWVTVVTPG